MENRRLRRELSSKNSDFNRLQQEFTAFKQGKEEEIKKWTVKYRARSDEYDKLLIILAILSISRVLKIRLLFLPLFSLFMIVG